MAKAKRIKDKDGKEIVIAKDGRTMHENSLANFEGTQEQWQPGQSGNLNGRPKSADKLFKVELVELMQGPDWNDKSKKEKKTLVKNVWKKAIDKYMTTDNDNTFLRLLELFVGSTDGKVIDQQSNNNTFTGNVLILPPKRDQPDNTGIFSSSIRLTLTNLKSLLRKFNFYAEVTNLKFFI